jgi:MFS family permease
MYHHVFPYDNQLTPPNSANLSQARQGDLERDLDMHGSDFNLATSIFFVGYLMMQLPSNLLITRLPPSIYLSCAATVWGVVSTCNGAVQSFGQLVAVRLILGFVECPFFPGKLSLVLDISPLNILSTWLINLYRRHLPDVVVVHPLRIDKAHLMVLLRQCTGKHVRWPSGTSPSGSHLHPRDCGH